MAGTCVHLAVAVALNQKFSKETNLYLGNMGKQYVPELFFAGNICPDGIMARHNYQRKMKLHSHLRDGIPDGTFQEMDNLALFRQRLRDFFVQNVYEQKREFSLYLGYLTHLLTDEKFILEIHPHVLQAIEAAGYSRQEPEMYALFGRDVDRIDFRLVAEYPGMEQAYQALRKVSPYEIKGLITEQELTDSRKWILSYFFETDHVLERPVFLPYERMYHFIAEAVGEIVDRLPEYLMMG
ncbi:MAG: zinc dependent phospholipase C family protein [Lachnospiraceae bacterium]|nr:zinc dependent phospholipase C family protein [Lachnospiraceae bacterium]